MKIAELFDLAHTQARVYLSKFEYPWEALSGIHSLIIELGSALDEDYTEIAPQVWVHKTAQIAPSAHLAAPCIIGKNTEVRHCAFVRGNALVGDNCMIGNSTELKNVILFDNAQVPHFNYVGDSILGYKAHMGAGSVTSNVKSDKSLVCVKTGRETIETGLKKFGAILGDFVEIGCNSVLNPGSVVGRNSTVYPVTSVRGVVPQDCIFKGPGNIVKKEQQ